MVDARNPSKYTLCSSVGCVALMSLIGLAAPSAHAQSTDQPISVTSDQTEDSIDEDGTARLDTVVIQGFRGSVQNAIDTKRRLDIVAEVVSAEDIGRLPDVSIAEALARLPGVTSQRTGGQASALNIRGLNQDLVSATLNGREQVGTSGIRNIEFDQYPAELINQAQVFKSPKASQIEGGVAGKVELKTINPLDSNGRVVSVNLRGSFNDRASQIPDANEFGYRVSFSYQDQFLNNRVGFAVGYARLVQPNVATRFTGFDFQTGSVFPDTFIDGDGALTGIAGTVLPVANAGAPVLDFDGNGISDTVPFGFESVQFGGQEIRDGVVSVLEFQPTNNVHILIDGYYSRFDSDVFRRGARLTNPQNITSTSFILNPDDPSTALGLSTGAAFIENPVLANNAIIGGTFLSGNGLNIENVNQDEGDSDELFTVGGNFAWDITDRLTVATDISFSSAESFFNNSGVTTEFGVTAADGSFTDLPFVVDFFRDGLNPAIQSFSNDFTDPALNPVQGFFIVPQADEDDLFAVAGDVYFETNFGPIQSIEFGARYTDRQAVRTVTSFSGPAGDGVGAFGLPSPQIAPDEFLSTGGFFGEFAAAGQPDFLVIDIDDVLSTFLDSDLPTDQFFGFTEDQSFIVNEDTIAGYAQANLDTRLLGIPVTGNIGLRIVNTDQSSITFSSEDVVGVSFTQFLPSANFSFDVGANQKIRLSGSRQISRPSFLDLGGGISVSPDTSGFLSGGGGNPSLLPFLANQVDFTFENYFSNGGVFTAGFFYKALESFIVGGTDPEFDFGAIDIDIPPQVEGGEPITSLIGFFSGPVNGEGGNVFGFEVNYTQQFEFLPRPFDGLGVVLNYSYTESSIELPPSALSGTVLDVPLEGLSAHVSNPQIFYQYGGFETRFSVRFRSGFVANQFGLSEQITGFDGETILDWQASYAFPDDHPLAGLQLLLQGNNLTDSESASFFGFEEQTGNIQQFGRQFFFGATYVF